MYAIIRTGGKQYRVEAGQRLEVERVGAEDGAEVQLPALMLVDGERVLATPAELAGASVTARVLADTKGRKIHGFTYKPKSNQRKRWGHRQKHSLLEITAITPGAVGAKSGK